MRVLAIAISAFYSEFSLVTQKKIGGECAATRRGELSTTRLHWRTASPPVSTAKSGFIIGPIADSLLIIGAPLLALVLGGILFAFPESYFQVVIKSNPTDLR